MIDACAGSSLLRGVFASAVDGRSMSLLRHSLIADNSEMIIKRISEIIRKSINSYSARIQDFHCLEGYYFAQKENSKLVIESASLD